MNNNFELDTLHTLNQHVRTMHRLLNQLDSKLRLEYIKEMLPTLLSYNQHSSTSVQQKLKERMHSPVETLSDRERELINDLGEKTERLYNAMNDESNSD